MFGRIWGRHISSASSVHFLLEMVQADYAPWNAVPLVRLSQPVDEQQVPLMVSFWLITTEESK